jgi:CMP-2-keto-3-deoxyoctulosonic acid synthetase
MTNLQELRLLSSAISTLQYQLALADSVSDQIEVLERLRALQHCQNIAVNQLLERRKNKSKVP